MDLAKTIRKKTQKLQAAALSKKLTIATAESCTGGLLGSYITEQSGSSAYFLGGVVTYSNESKQKLLGVSHGTLISFGAVSEETAKEMARGIREKLDATLGISITGVAGPGGGTEQKPVGTVWIGLSSIQKDISLLLCLKGDRNQIRCRAAEAALDMLQEQIQELP